MSISVRPGRADDDAGALLYGASPALYDIYAGSRERAIAMLQGVYRRRGSCASWEVCLIAELAGRPVGLLAGFPLDEEARRAQRLTVQSLARLPPWQWPATLRFLRAGRDLAPPAPPGSWYVDSLAVDAGARRRGAGRALLEAAAERARGERRSTLALDTALDNAPARALYRAFGMVETETRPTSAAATRLGVRDPGYVGYVKDLA